MNIHPLWWSYDPAPISGGITALHRRDGMGTVCCGMGSRGGAVCSQISLPQSCNEANWSPDFQARLRLGQGSESDATFSVHSLLSSLELSVSRKITPAAGNHPQPVCNTSWCSTFTPPPNILEYLLCRLILYLETPRRKLQESWIAEFLCSLTVPS